MIFQHARRRKRSKKSLSDFFDKLNFMVSHCETIKSVLLETEAFSSSVLPQNVPSHMHAAGGGMGQGVGNA